MDFKKYLPGALIIIVVLGFLELAGRGRLSGVALFVLALAVVTVFGAIKR